MRYVDEAKYKFTATTYKQAGITGGLFQNKAMKIWRTIPIPAKMTLDRQLLEGPLTKRNASAQSGKASFRRRSHPAMCVVTAGFNAAPKSASRIAAFGTQDRLEAAMHQKIGMNGGTENTLNRVVDAYPDEGSVVSRPPSDAEVIIGMLSCGLSMKDAPAEVLRPFPLVLGEGEGDVATKVNMKADSGFPVLAKFDAPGAAEMILQITKGLWEEMCEAYNQDPVNGIWNWVRELEETRPHLIALKGKCKSDCYKQAKIEGFQMRFYNCVGRQNVLNMQRATQPFEGQARSILMMPDGTSAQGVSLVRGGADALVSAIDAKLRRLGFSYVHVGDDSLVTAIKNGKLYIFSLDCSNFDITQHGDATEKIHQAIRWELEKFEPRAAQLWYALARERVVVTHKWAAYKWFHGGPSGMPLQSKVNDVLMDIVLQRVVEIIDCVDDKKKLEKELERIGAELHLKIRLEDYEVVEGARSLREGLAYTSFLFVGYYFYQENGHIYVCCDLPRSLAQMPFPGLTWTDDKNEHNLNEAMRLGSIVMNMGRPPIELRPAMEAMKDEARKLLDRAIARYGDVTDEKLLWACQDNPMAARLQPSLVGLRNAIDATAGLWEWTQEEPEMPSTSTLQWADLVDEDEADAIRRAGFVPPHRPAKQMSIERLRAMRVRATKAATHPATLANVGRPPPTAVWEADKKPTIRKDALERAAGGGKNRGGYRYSDDELSYAESASWDGSEASYGYE